MVATRVGYAGGRDERPTYRRIGDHLEAVEVTYDPRRITYERLLSHFWSSHPVVGEAPPSRVREAILFADAGQRRLAVASHRRVARREGEALSTAVLPVGTFWPAEPMHQKLNLRRSAPELVDELAPRFGGHQRFFASPLAARLNALAGGFGGDAALAEAAAMLGWSSQELRRRLQATAPDHGATH